MSISKAKRRTQSHVLAEVGYNFVVSKVLSVGFATQIIPDYGSDGVILTFDAQGAAESGTIGFQLKSRSSVKRTVEKSRSYISVSLSQADIDYFVGFKLPFYVIVYDACHGEAYWCEASKLLRAAGGRVSASSLTFKVPAANVFGAQALLAWQDLKNEILGGL